MEFFEELDNNTYPLIVLPIIGHADVDEGAYVSFTKGNNVVGGAHPLPSGRSGYGLKPSGHSR